MTRGELRILIVDDSETTRRIIRAIINCHEWIICGEAHTGWAGVSQFETLKPNLVLIDLAMPDLNGFEVAKKMNTVNPKVPLILFTALELHGIESHAKNAGISAVVAKAQAWDLVKIIEGTAANVSRHDQWDKLNHQSSHLN
jgi:PleD family two-component response regulator